MSNETNEACQSHQAKRYAEEFHSPARPSVRNPRGAAGKSKEPQSVKRYHRLQGRQSPPGAAQDASEEFISKIAWQTSKPQEGDHR